MTSLWLDTVQLPAYEPLNRDIKTDVLIIGGGLAGLLCAYMLEQAGIRCVLVEANRLCAGTTGHTTAKITSQHGLIYAKLLQEFGAEKARLYWDANEKALEQYRMLSQKISCDFESQDSYIYTIHSKDRLEKELSALKLLDIPAEYAEQTALPFSTAGAIRFQNQAQFHPLKFLAGILPGLEIYENTAVQSYNGHAWIANGRKITAAKTIITTHFPFINKHGGFFLKLYQQRSYVLALQKAAPIQGMYLDENQGGFSFRSSGDFLLIGSGSHRTGKGTETIDTIFSDVFKWYPSAIPVYQWATQDCMSLDGVPYIGRYSRNTPDLFVATGFNKWGMSSSMVSALLLTDLICEKQNPYVELFDPSRTILRPQLFTNTIEAVKNLLTPTTPRCPHMGCALKWNAQEHSWDCPCHGSRFSENGVLLNNPATGHLKQIKKEK